MCVWAVLMLPLLNVVNYSLNYWLMGFILKFVAVYVYAKILGWLRTEMQMEFLHVNKGHC